jgi:hypothetical protein
MSRINQPVFMSVLIVEYDSETLCALELRQVTEIAASEDSDDIELLAQETCCLFIIKSFVVSFCGYFECTMEKLYLSDRTCS